ncbi:MAG: anthranilate phosphoribosyltransferase [Bacteroidia bacterium]
MKQTLESLYNQHTLDRKEAGILLGHMAEGRYNEAQIASFLTVFQLRGITLEELIGFRQELLARCKAVDLSDYDPVDLCGTGGDGKDTFNISTLSAFVVAGAGIKVAKHGNYAVSSTCGSSNVLEALGYRFHSDETRLRQELERSNICFLHAPLFHPAMKAVGPVRRNLGVRTFFNMLGPLVNPAFPKKQLVGVFSLELQRFYQYLFQQSEATSYRIVHSLDGYDEISLTGPVKVVGPEGESVLEPGDFGFQPIDQEDLFGGKTIEEAVQLFVNVLDGKGSEAQQAAVISNSAMAISCAKPELHFDECMAAAMESLQSGKAKTALTQLVQS